MPRTSPPRKDKNRVPRQKRELTPAAPKEAERVAKVVARAGLGSRREIEEWIEAGRVAVNGEVLTSPAVTVTPQDAITVDGAPLPERERTRLFLYHKPKGVVTTNRDPEGRTTLFEILPGGLPRLVSVGRLDLNSEGLLLLTNDGGLARVLELPETGWLRRYRVRANGAIDQAQLDRLLRGITVDGVEYGPIEAELDRVQGANAWITVSLREGKNREIRNVLGALGLQVNRLIRVSYGPFQLGEIAEGGIEEVRTRVLRDQIGAELSAASGADFEGPVVEREVEDAPVRPAYRPAGRKQEAADRAGGLKVPARRTTRSGDEAYDAPVTDVIRPAAGPRVRRRLTGETPLENRGTVADRKGRTVKVERVTPRPDAPGPRAGGHMRDGERPHGRGRDRDDFAFDRPKRGPAGKGRPPFRSDERGPRREAEGQEDFRRRPTRSGPGSEERPRRPWTDAPPRQRDDARPSGPRRDREERFPRGDAQRRPYGDEGGFKRSGPRRSGEGERFGSERPQGDRPFRPRPRPEGGERDERPAGRGRSFGDKPGGRPGGFSERPQGDRPFRPRPRPEGGERDERPAGRGRSFGDKPAGGRPGGFSERPQGDRPFRPRPRPEGGERDERPAGRGRSFGDKPAGGRPGGFSERPQGDRPFRPRPEGGERDERPAGRGRSFGDKPAGGRPGGFGGKPGGKPGGRPGGKPGGFGGKPGGRPGGGKPGAGRGGKPMGKR
ncbi:pseudouridine synthase [Xanthobacter sp. AM11]|uniref:pseudouridine synthase n=1 Tax=Xanthobacter sp. AM11 TaxID=3380643 RepID=UPI0039BFBF04